MKKRNCKIIMSMLCAAMCLTSNSLMVFADTNANINAGEFINMKSDGNQGIQLLTAAVLTMQHRQS